MSKTIAIGKNQVLTLPIKWLAMRARELEVAAAAPKPLVMGRDLIALGMKPGEELGKVLKAAYEAQLDGKFDSKDKGLEFVSSL